MGPLSHLRSDPMVKRIRGQAKEAWRREWRRTGAGMIGGTFLVGGTWLSASHTFVAKQNGQLVRPAPWGWLLYVCIAGFAVGCYLYAATYLDWLPMFGRRPAELSDRRDSAIGRMDRLRAASEQGDSRVSVRIEDPRPPPLSPPLSYQLAQLRQAMDKLQESVAGFDEVMLDSAFARMERQDIDPTYEPLKGSAVRDAIEKLVSSNELVRGELAFLMFPASGSDEIGDDR